MALALRYQGTSSAKFTHFKIRPDVINLEYTAWAEPWTDGNIYLAHQFFLDANVQRRRTVIPHEMFHFLVYPHNAGVPSDQRECGDGNDRCYGFGGAMELVAKDPDLACTNIDNLVLWMCYRYLRWGGASWHPQVDDFGAAWCNDPISDDSHTEWGVVTEEEAQEWLQMFADDLAAL